MAEGRRGRRGGAAAAAALAAARRPVVGTRLAGFGAVRTDLPGWIAACIAQEIENRRLFPWLAVAFGTGIVLAFSADGPLSPLPPLLAGSALAGAAFATRRRGLGWLVLLSALAAIFLGFAAAVIRIGSVAAPALDRMTIGPFEGFVESVEERSRGGRIVIRLAKLDRLEEGARPARIRVTVRALGSVAPGDYVSGSARLLPPPEAARPGGYDFARDAFFRGLGGVGSVSGKLTVAEPPPAPPGLGLRWAAAVDRARNVLTSRIATSIGGQAGAVSAALITGKRGLIDDHSNDILRAAGIYHIVSISGLHMVLAAGVFFWATRALLALSPALALGWPIKKIAALVGMLGATGYDIFSGSDVATERSLLMILVMQGAVLFDRPALSLRNLAVSALVVLACEPEAVLGPSFQMSYAAVAGLIAFAEWERRLRPAAEPGDPLRRAWIWVARTAVGVVGTTVVATLATGPFGTFHFQNLQPYGVIGNAVTLPLISFVVMPAAVIGVLAFPFGLDRPVWIVMGWATEGVLRLSEWISHFPASILIVPAYGAGALLCLVGAILCATLFQSGLRWLAAVPAALGLALAATAPRPDIYVARDGSGAAIRAADGRLALVGKAAGFTAEQWLRADGDPRRATDPALRTATRCDRIGCTVALADGRIVSFLADRRGFAEDCRRAAVIVSRLQAPEGCAASAVIDRTFLAARGATALRAIAGGFGVATAREPGASEPWRAAAKPPGRPASPRRSVPDPGQPRPRTSSEADRGTRDGGAERTPDGDIPDPPAETDPADPLSDEMMVGPR